MHLYELFACFCPHYSAFMCVVVHRFLRVRGIYQEFGFGFRVRKCGPRQREVYEQEFRTPPLVFWKEEKRDYPPRPPRVPSVVRQILKVGKGKHIPKDTEGVGFPQACDEEETQRLLQIGGALARRVRTGQLFGLFPIPTPMGGAANSDFVPLRRGSPRMQG